MANYDQRNPLDYRFGQLSGGVTSLDTELSSAQFADLPDDLSTVRYVPITLADDSTGVYETVWVVGHAAGSQAVTVVRGREATTARGWSAGTTWRIAPTIRDVLPTFTRATLPVDAHLGMRAMLTDEGRVVEKVPTGWKATDFIFGHAGRTAGFQNVPADPVVMAAQELVGGMTFANNGLVVPVAGRYLASMRIYASAPTSGVRYSAAFQINGVSTPITSALEYKATGDDFQDQAHALLSLAAGDRVTLSAAGVNIYGTTGYNGTWLELLYMAP